jgi:nucleotide-binding universal stress UspA family protein
LRDEEAVVDRSVDAMERIAQQVMRGGITVRSVSFLSDDVGRDLAHVAETQQCDTVLLGWHRASLEQHVVRALVHRVFRLAPCHVVVFVDRRGLGVQPQSGASVALVASSEESRAAAKIGESIAESLPSKLVSLRPEETIADACAAVVSAGADWNDEAEFGQPATAIARKAECPVFIVRAGAPAPHPGSNS